MGLPLAAAGFGTVLLAVPFDTVPQIGRDLRSAYSGKIVLDATNNLRDTHGSEIYREARESGVAQTVAKYLPTQRIWISAVAS
ncbi:putative dinucleotide-binding enzyme [Pseudomonas citronellolis]|uniref:hypothetical protein n=1 Tax=Pseudomonas citronellolis TaxID=53408 RepID=UPI00209F3432|nr:hypothetical protein [Pseudomonas citronellolis]MCP1644984.1 putative dinucleotide-binding enzyme [Pseudomonas citronellolis]MCP1668016.1 putative dinucleotide-binding enzyme [Pseudomonas citronellolis]MCP1699138.1 putative dinucleotide-binding enzyme [Pseudomonas citronellolis]MCP1705669.1 putative dinucleotide-binding enzyme [Pseudomonas citronellolis]MCP1799702.1 putative dinucleotide-binding enzyme [Pseudomonas citronellolis]